MAIGPQNNFPSLQTIADLTRTLVNDDKQGATGTPGEGQILTNSSVTLQNLMNSALREACRDVRIMGQTALIRDNYVLLGVPPVNSSLGVGVMNPAVQVSLQSTGFFDGLMMWPNFTLPGDMLTPIEMWERASGTNYPFGMMKQSEGALAPRNQVQALGDWEFRNNSIWMNGAILERDVRLRYFCTLISLALPNADWTQIYVPIPDCQEQIADKIAHRYAARLGGDQEASAGMQAKDSLLRQRQQDARRRQFIDYKRPAFGQGRAGNAGNPAKTLY